MKTDQKLNMTMLCDFYELTMGNGYLKAGFQDRITYFDVYFRSVPDGGGYAIAAGLDQLIDYIEDLHFDQQDIDYLRGRGIFCGRQCRETGGNADWCRRRRPRWSSRRDGHFRSAFHGSLSGD